MTRPVRASFQEVSYGSLRSGQEKAASDALLREASSPACYLSAAGAVVVRVHPFTICLKDRVGGDTQPLRLKIGPGSKTTGMALVREGQDEQAVLNLFALTHRGDQIHRALDRRRGFRRRRRNQLRHRPARFDNRTRLGGWLPPSLQHRVDTIVSWVNRLRRVAPIAGLTQEVVRFDLQAMENLGVSAALYQQGELAGYEVREYLLQKFDWTCVYCVEPETCPWR